MCAELELLAVRYNISGFDRDRKIFVEARKRQGLDEPSVIASDYTNFVDRGWLPAYIVAEVRVASSSLAAE